MKRVFHNRTIIIKKGFKGAHIVKITIIKIKTSIEKHDIFIENMVKATEETTGRK